MSSIKIENMSKIIQNELAAYSEEVTEEIKSEIISVTKLAKENVKSLSPVNKGVYKKGWKSKVMYQNSSDIRTRIYNSSKEAPLVHLLEDGHMLVSESGKVLGRVAGSPHIKPTYTMIESKLVHDIKSKILGG